MSVKSRIAHENGRQNQRRDQKQDIISLATGRTGLQGVYLDDFMSKVDGLDYFDTMTLYLELDKMQETSPGFTCDCNGANDCAGCTCDAGLFYEVEY